MKVMATKYHFKICCVVRSERLIQMVSSITSQGMTVRYPAVVESSIRPCQMTARHSEKETSDDLSAYHIRNMGFWMTISSSDNRYVAMTV